MVDNKETISNIVNRAILVDKTVLGKSVIKKVIKDIETSIQINWERLVLASKIDNKNHNGFVVEKQVVKNIFTGISKEEIYYGKVIESKKDTNKVYGLEYLDCGNVFIFNKGNFYVVLELLLRNFIVGNTSIVISNGYMYGVNSLLIGIIKEVLKQNDLDEDFVNLFITEDIENVLDEYINVDLNIVIGSRDEQRRVIDGSKVAVLASGYLSYDLYIDDFVDKDFLVKIINTGLDINIYLNEKLKVRLPGALVVDGVKEAIATINYNGSRYTSTIFTKDTSKAASFINKVKSKVVTVNTSPAIQSVLDISEKDLVLEKTIIYPRKKNK